MKKIIIYFSMFFCLILGACKTANINNTTNSAKNSNFGSKIEEKQYNNTQTNENTKKTEIKETNTNTLETKELNWYFETRKDGLPPNPPKESKSFLSKYPSYYLGNTEKKDVYITFDEGYENGFSAKILDILKDNQVKAAFFVTTHYINSNKDLIKRMVDEGHLVCNHSTTHPSMAKVAKNSKEKFKNEIITNEKAFEEITGKKMPKYFRPPMGKYSELSLQYTKDLGYKTIFWSFAYNDWDINNQPNAEKAKKIIMERTHNGCIYLLHAVSKTNTDILDSLIKDLKDKGYTFKTLDDLP
ncbi:peptidoglycan-N-acetylmuramic acid deacetylase PdaA precursor [Clostridium acetireducens DSM 10703]|jgi:peptidoglycan-N-acetylmuramic acid deacetylase|uniref:Peptidoglycan-N-acetylmuramic acid deacetylase PdaA n=1 Tax=Clostridium acetireducens DSM 10703 TaxID=1121290 RepID=A0A1E8EXZ6_9CLOT|nr:delta-lactam-biosynthetic de-N-acetylase [Clostridium acetireducens]OFI05802.1 peptidoglycan-N-acetylmuramic acid deacetylase PdaA precursor [Clostridium acetireducens DSM 10703]